MPRLPSTTLAVAAAALLAGACSGGSSMAPEPDPRAEPCRLAVEVCSARLEIGPELYLRHYRTHDLDLGAEGPTRALVIVHGASRNAVYNFNTGLQATLGGLEDDVAVIAPHFITADEAPLPDEPFWSSNGWKKGHLSVTDGPTPRVSSYAALDTIVARLSNPSLFPNLEEIVVAGHSAGGQVTHRYAAGGMPPRGVPIRYIVANPSTFLFLGPERPDGSGGWTSPPFPACPEYREWHFGLEGLNSYMSQRPEEVITQNLVSREVTVMLGDADTGSEGLDVTCGANLQGPHRYARGLNLLAYMDAFYPEHRHTGLVVPGVGHSSRGVFLSPEGLAILLP